MKIIDIYSKKHGHFEVIVDDKDFDILSSKKWCICKQTKKFYARNVDGLMHRFLLKLKDSSIHVDHKNGNTLDNRRKNIRKCTISQNQANRPALKGKFIGVSWAKTKRKWAAQIKKFGHVYNLGVYDKEEDAALAYNAAAPVLHGKFAYLNKIP